MPGAKTETIGDGIIFSKKRVKKNKKGGTILNWKWEFLQCPSSIKYESFISGFGSKSGYRI